MQKLEACKRCSRAAPACLQGLAAEEVPFGSDPDDPRRQCKRCVLHLQFHAIEDYPSEAGLTWRELRRTVEDAFAKKVEAAVVKAFKRAAYSPGIETMPEAREGGGKRGAAEDSGDENAPAVANTAQLNDAGEDAEDENKEVRGRWCERWRVSGIALVLRSC